MTLTNDFLQSRRAYDFRVTKAMAESSRLIDVQAFASPHDLKKRRNQITEHRGARSAGYFLVRYEIMSIVGPGKYHKGFDVVFDLASKGTYPEEQSGSAIDAGGIVATCDSRPLPWSPHFLDGIGTICLGSVWKGAARTLLGHAIIHVAKLLNWDEPMNPHYGGWNTEAIKWWRRHFDSKPITPDLDYPSLPVDLTHGRSSRVSDNEPHMLARSAAGSSGEDFRIIKATGPSTIFKKQSDGIVSL